MRIAAGETISLLFELARDMDAVRRRIEDPPLLHLQLEVNVNVWYCLGGALVKNAYNLAVGVRFL